MNIWESQMGHDFVGLAISALRDCRRKKTIYCIESFWNEVKKTIEREVASGAVLKDHIYLNDNYTVLVFEREE